MKFSLINGHDQETFMFLIFKFKYNSMFIQQFWNELYKIDITPLEYALLLSTHCSGNNQIKLYKIVSNILCYDLILQETNWNQRKKINEMVH